MAIPLSYSYRNLMVRKTTTVMTALGIALTVTVLLGIAALVDGLRGALEVTGHPRQLIVMRQGSAAELVSVVLGDKFDIIRLLEGIERIDGEPAASHEVISVVSLPLRSDMTQSANINVRGLSPVGLKMRDGIRLVEGRWFEPGKREVVVGEGLHGMRAQTSVGDKIEFGRGEWEVVGVFDAGRSAYNSEAWADGNLATSDLNRGNARSAVLVRAQDAVAAEALKNRIEQDQRLLLEAETEHDYYAKQMSSAAPIQGLGVFVALIMAIGSCFAAMNTMYTAVARRSAEIGTLRMLGFSRGSILVSFMLESLALSLLGGALGCLLVLPLNGLEGRIGNFITFSETTFSFQVTPQSMMIGVAFAALMGVFGGLLPARMAARKTILGALRDA